MNWKTLEFDQLTAHELYWIMRARSAVFVVEQAHVCLDADGRDEQALHVFGMEQSDSPMPLIAYARLLPGDAEDPDVTIDKVLTSPARRGDGTAELLIEHALRVTSTRWPGRTVRVMAPVGLKDFYEQFGFRKTEGPFLEYGVAYIGLTRRQRPGRMSWAGARGSGLSLVNTYELL